MSSFTKNIETQKGGLTFYFNRIYTVNGVKYHVSVRNGRFTHYFMMEDGNEQWHFTDITALPDWIIILERKLENVIHQHLQEG